MANKTSIDPNKKYHSFFVNAGRQFIKSRLKDKDIIYPVVELDNITSYLEDTFFDMYVYLEDNISAKDAQSKVGKLFDYGYYKYLGIIDGKEIIELYKPRVNYKVGDPVIILNPKYKKLPADVVEFKDDYTVTVRFMDSLFTTKDVDVKLNEVTLMNEQQKSNYQDLKDLTKPYKKDTLVILDGHYVLHKSLITNHSHRLLETDEFIGGVVGVISTIFKFLIEQPNTRFVVVFDKGGSAKASKFSDYKKTRVPHNEKFWQIFDYNIKYVKEFCKLANIPCYQEYGWEGDDLIASVVKEYKDKYETIIINSSDHDLWQLLYGEKVKHRSHLKSPTGGLYTYAKDVEETYKINSISKFGWVKAIIGDVSDNIPSILSRSVTRDKLIPLVNEANTIEEFMKLLEEKYPSLPTPFITNYNVVRLRDDYFAEHPKHTNTEIDIPAVEKFLNRLGLFAFVSYTKGLL